MDLTKVGITFDRPGLARLARHLPTVVMAADVMAEGGLEPEISLTAEATMLRAAPILSLGAEPPEPVLVEHLPDLPVIIEDLPPATPPAAGAGGGRSEGQPRPASPHDHIRVTGPLTKAERAEILRRHAAGDSSAAIARDLGRRAQSVGLFLAAQNQKGKPQPKGGFRPVGEVSAAVVGRPRAARKKDRQGQPAPAETAEGQDPDPVAAMAAATEMPAPVAGGAGSSILGGDGEGLQRDGLAEKAPLQAAGAGIAAMPPAAEGPGVELNGEERRIWAYLAALPMPRGWDIELDIDMAEVFGRGARAQMVADDLGVDSKQLVERYQQLTAVIRDDRGRMTIDGQTAFVRVLRLLVKHRRQQAA